MKIKKIFEWLKESKHHKVIKHTESSFGYKKTEILCDINHTIERNRFGDIISYNFNNLIDSKNCDFCKVNFWNYIK